MKEMNGKRLIEIFDTTLRDGGQKRGISFSRHDKLMIAKGLDLLGVDYIEGGYPGSNEEEAAFFEEALKLNLKRAKLAAFGMTCQKGKNPQEDQQLARLLNAGTQVVVIVGKTSRKQVENTLGISGEENLRIIEKTCKFLVGQGREVFFDAEHFFDGWKFDAAYSLGCLCAAKHGGASKVILCDTNGGSLPWEIEAAVISAKRLLSIPVGIHTHNDGGMAVANSLIAIKAGADQVQGTINGYGERCGNVDLCSIIPALKFKMNLDCNISNEDLVGLTNFARFTAEIANLPLNHEQPYVGPDAFVHKAGLHASAVSKDPDSYNHIKPELVGNSASVMVSKLSGRSNISMKAKEFGIALSPEQVKKVLTEVERLENMGFQFEGADGSLKLIMMHQADGYIRPFEVLAQNVSSARFENNVKKVSAVVRLLIKNSKSEIAYDVADGDGPVNALDNALRRALLSHFPYLEKTKLDDYKVRVLDGEKGTAKAVRVLIDFYDGEEGWTTVGCSTDVVEASAQALLDSFELAIFKHR